MVLVLDPEPLVACEVCVSWLTTHRRPPQMSPTVAAHDRAVTWLRHPHVASRVTVTTNQAEKALTFNGNNWAVPAWPNQ